VTRRSSRSLLLRHASSSEPVLLLVRWCVTEAEKRALMAAYGNTAPVGSVELDHTVSLGVGGAANDPADLSIEDRFQARSR
jgi:hypothetical protein